MQKPKNDCGVKLGSVFFFHDSQHRKRGYETNYKTAGSLKWQPQNFEKNEIKKILLCESFDHVKSS